MFPVSFQTLVKLLLSCLLLAAGTARGQWAVYESVFLVDEATSVNFSPYTGAYIIVPAGGGAASFLFTVEAEGRFYSIAENSGRYFIAANKTTRRAVLSSISQNGGARVMYQASGPLNSTIAYTLGTDKKGASVPAELNGLMLASDDESSATAPAEDGSIGMAGSASFTAVLRADLSHILNQKESSMTDAVEMIAGLLDKYGYLPDGAQEVTAASESATPADAPAGPANEAATSTLDDSLFPPGSREEMERSLQEAVK